MMNRHHGWSLSLAAAVLVSAFSFSMDSLAAIKANYSEVRIFMRELQAANPHTTELFELGTSDSGQVVEGLKIGSGKIKTLIVGTHHGNEYGATEVAMGAAKDLATNPIADQTVYVIPVLNIQGYNDRDRYEMSAANQQSHDPNRDYPGPCGTEGPFALKSTHMLADFVAAQGIVTSATLHTFYPAVVYPWGLGTHDLSTPYDDTFKQIVNAATKDSHYQVGNSTEVIYPANGTFEDYAFWKHGIWSILFELGETHTPSQAQVDEMVRVNVPGLRAMLLIAPQARAVDHDFHGKCDASLRSLDRHDE